MTIKGQAIDCCREIAHQRDAAATLVERRYYETLLDTAVEDLITINRWNRKAAKKRLKRMRTA